MARGAGIDALHEVIGLAFPGGVEHRVGIEEQQPGVPRGVGPGAHLCTAIGRRGQQLGTGLIGDLARAVGGAAVDDDHFAHQPFERRRHERCECRRQRRLGIEGGDDDGDHGFLWHVVAAANNRNRRSA